MRIALHLLLTLILVEGPVRAQQTLPVLRSSASVITIVDGDERRTAYWSLDPSARPDIYTADRTRRSKVVRFITDRDSLSFTLKPGEHHDLVILLNDTDSCYTRLRSAITPEMLAYEYPPAQALPDTIPFRLTPANNVLLQAVLNEVDTLTLMFHTGMRGTVVIDEARKRMKAFHMDGQGSVGTSWGGSAQTGVSLHNELRIGQQRMRDLEIHVDELSGEGSDGKVGYDFFADQVLEMDYDKGLLIVHDRPPQDLTGHEAVPITYVRGSFYIRCSLSTGEGMTKYPFMVHTGYSGALIMGAHSAFPVRDSLGVEVLRDSYNNVLRNVRTIIPELVVGEERFTDVPASVMDPRAKIEANVIGGDVLKRFNWILDLRNDVLYLKPNTAFGKGWKND